jgi:hypothetical protein
LNESEELVESADLSRGAQLRTEHVAGESTEDRKLDCDPLLFSARNPRQATNDSKNRLRFPYGIWERSRQPLAFAIFVRSPSSVTDFMPIIRLAHSAKLRQISIQDVAVSRRQVIVIDDTLNAFDGFIKLVFIEPASIPLPCKIAQVALRTIQALPVVTRETPSLI